MTGYHLQALDGEIGHIEDFVIDDETWAIRYLIVGTKNWWPGKKVLVSPAWIERVSWSKSKIFINLAIQAFSHTSSQSQPHRGGNDISPAVADLPKIDLNFPGGTPDYSTTPAALRLSGRR